MSKMLRLSEEDLAARKAGRKPEASPLEHEIQRDYFRWWREYAKLKRFPEKLCFAIPNAADLSGSGRIYKWSEGLTAGVSDVFLSIARRPYHGLYLEFKRAKKEATDQQMSFGLDAISFDYDFRVVHSAAEAIAISEAYLSGKSWT